MLRVRLDRTQLTQQPQAVADLGRVGRFDEREALDVAQLGLRHLQNHRGQVGTQNLGLGELWPRLEVVFVVEPNADAGRDASAASGPLVGRGL